MLEEAPVLGGERRLDQEVGKFVERHRVVAEQAALADLVAEAVIEGDAVLVGQVHLALGEVEGGEREGERPRAGRRRSSVKPSQARSFRARTSPRASKRPKKVE